jgi:hypothetical protein
MPAPALPKPAAAAGDILKALSLVGDVAAGVVIGAAVWIAANTLYLRALWRPDIDDIFSNFDLVSQLPYLLIGAAFQIYANLSHKQLPKVVGTGLLCSSLGVFFLTAHQWLAETPFPQNLFLLGIAICFPAGIVAAFVERLIELRVADFGKSLGFTKGQNFGEWAGSVLTCSLIIWVACEERPGRIGVSIIASIIIGSLVKEWVDYRRTGRKSAELLNSIKALKIGGPVAALAAIGFWLLTERHVPLAKFIGVEIPLIAAIFCALAIPTFLLAYKGTEQRLLACCHTASAYWGIGAVGGGFIFICALLFYFEGKEPGPQVGQVAVLAGFACCLIALLIESRTRRRNRTDERKPSLAYRIVTGTYTAAAIIKLTIDLLIGIAVIGVFPAAILATSRTNLHVFHPATSEDWLYLGIFLAAAALILFGLLQHYLTVTTLVKGPLGADTSPPGGRSNPFSDEFD